MFKDMKGNGDGSLSWEVDVYCPWDVMNYIRGYQLNPIIKPTSYWKNTSDNAIIRSFIDYAGGYTFQKAPPASSV